MKQVESNPRLDSVMDYVLLRVHTIVRDTVTSITTNETKHVLKAQNHIRTVLTRILVNAILICEV